MLAQKSIPEVVQRDVLTLDLSTSGLPNLVMQ
jgi:hypothetical protein